VSGDAGQKNSRAISLVLVAAVAENGVIGRDNALPWRLKSDMQHFRALTWGKPVLMGRKTFLSIGEPLKGRTNIVVSRDPGFAAPGVIVARELAVALAVARADALRRSADAIMVLGGAEIFAQTMPQADRLEISFVHARPEGDTFFPAIDPAVWRRIAEKPHSAGPDNSAPFTLISYERASRPQGGEEPHQPALYRG
jgi:dihydrofolate reductase